MNKLDQDYKNLLQDILDNGTRKMDRTKTGTLSVFGRQIRHKMKDGFPALTTKKLAFKTMVTELLWFLNGRTDLRYLVERNCNIWNGDAYKFFCNQPQFLGHEDIPSMEWFVNEIKTNDEFSKKFGDLGPIYGHAWRKWGERRHDSIANEHFIGIDQIANVISELKTNPDSRRLLVSAWNVADLPDQVLPPCHYAFQFYTRELSLEERMEIFKKQNNGSHPEDIEMMDDYEIPVRAISLMWAQRSCDLPLGEPINTMSYSLLLMMVAKQVNMVPDEVIGNFGDCHIYLNQIDGIKEQLTREPYELPTVTISDRVVNDISEYTIDDITLHNYKHHPAIKMPLSN